VHATPLLRQARQLFLGDPVFGNGRQFADDPFGFLRACADSYGDVVRLEGRETYEPYLERLDVGWLSLNQPPRRSPAYALQ